MKMHVGSAAGMLAPAEAKRPRMTPETPLPGAVPGLARLDPRIQEHIAANPSLADFLSKHKSVFQNLNEDSVGFLRRQLEQSKSKPSAEEEAERDEEAEVASRTVLVRNMSAEATESEVQQMFDCSGLQPELVTVPRESRRQRTCGVAYVQLASQEAAHRAVREMQCAQLCGKLVAVEMASSATPRPVSANDASEDRANVAWLDETSLWEVALFDRHESVVEFRGRLQGGPSTLPAQVPIDHARFQEATRREHAEERERIRQALGGPS